MTRLLRTVGLALTTNVSTILFAAGFVAMYAGVAGYSRPAANIVAGVVLMGLGVLPYLLRARRGSK